MGGPGPGYPLHSLVLTACRKSVNSFLRFLHLAAASLFLSRLTRRRSSSSGLIWGKEGYRAVRWTLCCRPSGRTLAEGMAAQGRPQIALWDLPNLTGSVFSKLVRNPATWPWVSGKRLAVPLSSTCTLHALPRSLTQVASLGGTLPCSIWASILASVMVTGVTMATLQAQHPFGSAALGCA